jgi:ribosomal protein S18 acetylase RimI-like enzyme
MASPAVAVEVLARHHDRSVFSCGKLPLDRYLQRQASQDVRRNAAAVFVVSAHPGSPEIRGYYTLTATSVLLAEIPEGRVKHFPYPEVPATLLGRLAVDSRFHRQGNGGFMLLDAALRASAPAAPASFAMIVDPIDEEATLWYEPLGFIRLQRQSKRLFIPHATLIGALTY